VSGATFTAILGFSGPNALGVVDPARIRHNQVRLGIWCGFAGPSNQRFWLRKRYQCRLPAGTTSVGMDLTTVLPFGTVVQVFFSGPGDVIVIGSASYPTPTFIGLTSTQPIDHVSIQGQIQSGARVSRCG